MKRFYLSLMTAVLALSASAQVYNEIPLAWKWLDTREVAFTYNGRFDGENDFAMDARTGARRSVKAPAKYAEFPIRPEGAVNLTYSPDSTMLAFTRDNDLYVAEIASGRETRLTFDGTELILNGYSSWVYYEEILGRPTRYCAFWWSPDSRKIGFYRFDNTEVPMFPIYSAKGQDGSLNQTRYPKCGEPNPKVRIGIVDVPQAVTAAPEIVWADFDEQEDQYFGTPFWGADSREFFISREPRTQNTLDLYSVSAADGSRKHIYHEEYATWLDWIEGMIFTEKGLYMVRSFETGWQQIYFLSYDGKELRRLTDGPNWRIQLHYVDEKKGDVYFTARRDATVRTTVYKADRKGVITALTDPAYDAAAVRFSPDGRRFVASLSNAVTPNRIGLYDVTKPGKALAVAELAGPDFDPAAYALPQMITLTTHDGLVLLASVVYPKNFDPARKYPVHMDIYGGPDTPQVQDVWRTPNASNQWWSDHGIIEITADCRAAGHNGRQGLDMIYRQLDQVETEDFVEWAKWLQSLPYVDADKIGVEGFSFGGTMTALLVMDHSEQFHYGIAGGGVYDWSLYDTHYTERFMDTPQNNPEGYARTRVISHAANYPVEHTTASDQEDPAASAAAVEPVMLKLTHGTGDDNVHFQNTLQLIDELQKEGKKFELMIYPDGMHGYRGYQGTHFQQANREFWLKYLKRQEGPVPRTFE